MPHKSIIVLIIRIVCLFGCTFQLYKVSSNFLEFKVRSEVTFNSPKKIEFPAIDIAIPIVQLINLTAFDIYSPNVLFNVCQAVVGQKIKKGDYLSQCEQALRSPRVLSERLSYYFKAVDIEKYTRDPTKSISYVSISKQKESTLIGKNCSVERYFNYQNIFIRISCLNGYKPMLIDAQSLLLQENPFSMIGFDAGFDFALRLSPVKSKIIGDPVLYKYINISPNKLNMIKVSFKKTVTRMLRHPYETDCRDFDKRATLEECMNNKTLQSSGKLFAHKVVPFGSYSQRIGFYSRDSNVTSELYEECAFKINFNECESINYNLEMEQIVENTKYGFCILVLEPMTPDMIYISLPAQNWLEFVIFIGSVLGMWFGVSMLSQMMTILRLCETYTPPTSVHIE